MIEPIIFSAPAVLLGLLMGTMLGIRISRSKVNGLTAKVAQQQTLIEQQAKQIWTQADQIHTIENEKRIADAWERPQDRALHERLSGKGKTQAA